jgi:hypothetical protein
MKSQRLLFALVLISWALSLEAASIAVTVKPASETMYVDMPVACEVSVTNLTEKPVRIFSTYPEFIAFILRDKVSGKTGNGSASGSVRTALVELGPKQSLTWVTFLNKLLPMDTVGQRSFDLIIGVMYDDGSESSQSVALETELKLNFLPISSEKKKEILESYYRKFEGGDSKDQMEAVGAICSVDSPEAISYLGNLFDNQVTFSHALAALKKNNNPEVNEVLLQGCLGGKASAEVVDILTERGVVIPNDKLVEMAGGRSDQLRFAVLQYVKKCD